jgi:septum formation protein
VGSRSVLEFSVRRYNRVAFFLCLPGGNVLTKRLVLASRSPRRLSLLRQIGFEPDVMPCEISEDFNPTLAPAQNAKILALDKARTVACTLSDAIVIGADTIVVIDGAMLGKPSDRADAIRMLERLSGRTHTVYTGFALVDRPTDLWVSDVEATLVTFRRMTRTEVEEYVDSGSPMDKAGAYGIQDDFGAVFVSRVEGCFYNVVGLPLSKLYTTMTEFQARLKQS